MNLSEPFIRRPVATTLIQLSILIFGVLGYSSLPVSDLPTVDFPTVQVNANLPGANPETMAASVATPLEKQFSTISGITAISSTSTTGSTQITLQFDLDRNIDAAAQDVQGAIARTNRSLPPDMPAPPSLQKVNPADFPIFFLTLSSPTLPLSDINEYAEVAVAQRLSTLQGRRPGLDLRLAEVRRSHRHRPAAARRPRARHRAGGHRRRPGQRRTGRPARSSDRTAPTPSRPTAS